MICCNIMHFDAKLKKDNDGAFQLNMGLVKGSGFSREITWSEGKQKQSLTSFTTKEDQLNLNTR